MTEQAVTAPPSPYKGLAAFEDSSLDALFFFGREREAEIVAANLLAYRLTVLYGASGVGKSSLLRAGVAQRLHHQGEAVVVFSAWSGDPVRSLIAEAGETLANSFPDARLEQGGSALSATVEAWSRALGRDLYLILDQLDEYFLYHESDEGFSAELAELVTRPGVRVNVLLSVRDDMLSRLDRFKALIPNLFSNYLRLDHLDRSGALSAVVGPLERYNSLVPPGDRVSAEPGLVDAVLDQTMTGRVELDDRGRVGVADRGGSEGRVEAPYLQLVMQRLWGEERDRGSRVLRLETLEHLGGAEAIVRAHLREALETLSPGERRVAAELFHHLVTPSGTKIAHRPGDLAEYASVNERELTPVLAALVEERIVRPVTPSAGEPDGSSYEIFHDVLAEPVVAWRSRYEADRELERTRAEARRRHRRLLLVAVVALLVAAVMVGVTIFAFSERSAARSQARRARARELAATALTGLESDPQASLRLAVEAARLSPSPVTEETLRRVLLESHERVVLRQGGAVLAVAFSPSGGRIASGGADGTIRLYASNGRALRKVSTGGAVDAVDFSPDGRVLAAASADGTVRLLDGRTGRSRRILHHPGGASWVAFGGDFLITAGTDGTARVWRGTGRLVSVLHNPGPVHAAVLSGDGKLAVTVARDPQGHSRARTFVARTGRFLRVLPERGIITVAASPDGRVVATGSADATARLWDAQSGRELHRLQHKGHVVDLSFSTRGKWLATASEDGVGRVWDVETGAPVAILSGATQPLSSISLDPSGRFAVLASRDGDAYVYEIVDSHLVALLAGHRGAVTDAVFSPEARRVATASEDGTLRLWDPGAADQLRLVRRVGRPVTAAFSAAGKIVLHPLRHEATPTARSPDGALFARARGNDVVVSRAGSGRELYTLVGHFGTVEAVSFSPDGRWLVTAGPRTAIVWQAATGEWLAPGFYLRGHKLMFRGRPAHLTSASFSPDGTRIVTASLDRTVRVYDCQACGNPSSLLVLAKRRLDRISAP